MKNQKGISMVALVVIIISMVILASFAVTNGFKYVAESKKLEEESLRKYLEEAVSRRREEIFANPELDYYGYTIDFDEAGISSKFKNLPDGIGGQWQIIDGEAADMLGVRDASEILIYNLLDRYDAAGNSVGLDYIKVAIANYSTGTVYILETSLRIVT